ncbi:NAD(P)/FAD-dependent oxidoreductase [Nocardia sp. NPDC058058]|uniref:NAD(P)/FAD-dependent oxidoreductase n=1 Tax=Nocardia sp. NPDC058058 TaxID=3346317 RepID=UPI0036DE4B89
MSINHHVVVLGAGYAGMMSALRLSRRMRHRGDVHITLVNPSPRFTERLRLHQLAAGHTLHDLRIEQLVDGTGIEFICGAATVIDTEIRKVRVETLGRVRVLDYDTLVYALGGVTEVNAVPGADQHTYPLDSVRQAATVARRLTDLAPGSAVTVCGGGLTGVETAAEIAETHPGLRVSLISRGEPAAMLSSAARAHVYDRFDQLGVRVHRGVVTKVLPDAVELSRADLGVEPDAGEWEATDLLSSDLTLWTTGLRGQPLAAESGIGTDAAGLVVTDPSLRARTHPDIYAAGDAAAIRQAWGQVHGTAQSALPSGAHVADSIARQLNGKEPKPFRFGYRHRAVSLGRGDGVVGFVRADGTPRRRVRTGDSGVRYKELASARPPRVFAHTTGLFGLLRPIGSTRGGRATRKPATSR